ncbi:MAG: hypothetical protein NXI14_03905 [bacterium]|nr:hypothetical protein [bacterium]
MVVSILEIHIRGNRTVCRFEAAEGEAWCYWDGDAPEVGRRYQVEVVVERFTLITRLKSDTEQSEELIDITGPGGQPSWIVSGRVERVDDENMALVFGGLRMGLGPDAEWAAAGERVVVRCEGCTLYDCNF